jgi:hypothetical protein
MAKTTTCTQQRQFPCHNFDANLSPIHDERLPNFHMAIHLTTHRPGVVIHTKVVLHKGSNALMPPGRPGGIRAPDPVALHELVTWGHKGAGSALLMGPGRPGSIRPPELAMNDLHASVVLSHDHK